MSNDIYMQIALIMLMGLLAKNAILIVEFALDRRKMGMSITWAAVLGAAARLRPILMTSLAMIVGLLPLMFASGAGANGNRTLGTVCYRRYVNRYDSAKSSSVPALVRWHSSILQEKVQTDGMGRCGQLRMQNRRLNNIQNSD